MKKVIGRFTLSEIHEHTYTYSMTSEKDDPFVLTQFSIDLEDGTYTEIEREEILGMDVIVSVIPFTEEEENEIKQILKEVRETE